MKPKELVRALVAMRFANTFNPYSDRCEQYDLDGAANQRRVTLERLLERAVNTGVDSLWIGRDLGISGMETDWISAYRRRACSGARGEMGVEGGEMYTRSGR